MSFAERLNNLMQSNGITKYRLSKLAGCSATTVANWLSGKEVTPVYLQKLSEIFSVSIDYLVNGNQKENITTHDSECTIDHRAILAAFWEGSEDLPEDELEALWNDASDYIRFKMDQRKKK